METVGDVYSRFRSQLSKSYEPNEEEQITVLAFEYVMNYRRVDVSLNKNERLAENHIKSFDKILAALNTGKPIQYVLGNSWFYGINLMVNKHVLIPRQETEELVDWIVRDIKSLPKKPSAIIDVCTGSGCIALALKKEFPEIKIIALDNSEKALEVARYNAIKENLEIRFIHMDALNISLDIYPDIIVCNPPYVMKSEKADMHQRVIDYEPSAALFVPDEDPLLFYRKVSSWGFRFLKPEGRIYFEINERMGNEIIGLHSELGYSESEIKKDLPGKDRMFRAINN